MTVTRDSTSVSIPLGAVGVSLSSSHPSSRVSIVPRMALPAVDNLGCIDNKTCGKFCFLFVHCGVSGAGCAG